MLRSERFNRMRQGFLIVAFASVLSAQVTREGEWWVRTLSGSEAVAPNTAVNVLVRGALTASGVAENKLSYDLKVRAKARNQAEARALLEAVTVTVQRSPGG